MKLLKEKQAIAVIGMAVGMMAVAMNSHAATATAPASANVITPITVSAGTSELNFGTFSAGTGGTVVVSAAATPSRNVTGAVKTSGTAISAAAFAVTGQASTTYAYSASTTALTSGSNTMALALSTSAGSTSGTSTLSSTGSDTIYVGGTLTVGASQAVGTYSGTITMTVDYN